MNNFTLKLNNTTYECSGTHCTKQDQDWNIRANMNGMVVTVTIPLDSKLTRLQVMAFVERLHEGMMKAAEGQKPTIEYTS